MSRVTIALLASLTVTSPALAQVTRVSVSTAGAQANGPSTTPATSANGRFVVFASTASNLVANDANGVSDIFLRDRDTDADGTFDEPGAVATTRISVGPGGVEANLASTQPAISADGRYVVFVSLATNLVAGDNGQPQVYRVDRTNGAIVRISESAAGATADLGAATPSISANGDVVAFASSATNLVPGASGRNIFVREVAADRTTRVSPIDPVPNTLMYERPTLAADGTRVGYMASPVGGGTQWAAMVSHVPTATLLARFDTAPTSATLSAAGTHLIVGQSRYAVDTRAVLPALLPLNPPLAPTAGAGSPSGRYLLGTGGTLSDFGLGVASSIGFTSSGAAFSFDDRWLVVASDSATLLPGGADTNAVSDVFAIDLPARLDQDADTMDDRWESFFGVTSASADPDGDGVTNAAEENAGSHPNGVQRRFFAEGATGPLFATRLWIANPDGANAARVVLNVDSGHGVRRTFPLALVAGGSAMVDLGSIPGFEASDASTIIESDRPVVADRAMEWGIDRIPNGHGYGSHAETAATSASTQWFLAEGSTVLGFDLFYMLQNPQTTVTQVTVRYLLSSGTVITRVYDMAPRSRTTIYVNVIPGIEEIDVSADISANAPIIAERSMYRNTPGQHFGVGTASMGVTAPATRWFLAEGATGSFFDLFVLMANPGDSDAVVTATYARENGVNIVRQHRVAAHSRFSVFVDSIPGLEHTSVATTLTSNVPIVVERAMYWPSGFFNYYEGHTSVGTTSTAQRWVIARGDGDPDTATFVLFANTENRPGQALVRIMTPTGFAPGLQRMVNLPANSRTTIDLPNMPPVYSILVTSEGPSPVELVVETAVYRSYRGALWASGSNAVATPLP